MTKRLADFKVWFTETCVPWFTKMFIPRRCGDGAFATFWWNITHSRKSADKEIILSPAWRIEQEGKDSKEWGCQSHTGKSY